MTTSTSVTRYCEARTRSGGLCKRTAGWGTPHVGRGRCKLHGGTSPGQIKHEARAEAVERLLAYGKLGHRSDIDSLDAAVEVVALTRGAVEAWRDKLAEAVSERREPSAIEVECYRAALVDYGRMTKLANDAGVADRLAKIETRQAEQITLAAEEALASISLDPEARAIFARTFAEALVRHGGDEPLQIGPGT